MNAPRYPTTDGRPGPRVIAWLARAWARLRGQRYGQSMWTASGWTFYPLDPRASEVNVRDIARSLAAACRYQGQIGIRTGFTFYSVAEHSVIVSQYVEALAVERGRAHLARRAARIALMHDASEAYVADVSRPLKYSADMRGYRKIEDRVQRAVLEHFDLHALVMMPGEAAWIAALIKEVDNRILIDEARAFMNGPDEEDWITRWGQPLECKIAGLPTRRAEYVFLARFDELFGTNHHVEAP